MHTKTLFCESYAFHGMDWTWLWKFYIHHTWWHHWSCDALKAQSNFVFTCFCNQNFHFSIQKSTIYFGLYFPGWQSKETILPSKWKVRLIVAWDSLTFEIILRKLFLSSSSEWILNCCPTHIKNELFHLVFTRGI